MTNKVYSILAGGYIERPDQRARQGQTFTATVVERNDAGQIAEIGVSLNGAGFMKIRVERDAEGRLISLTGDPDNPYRLR